ncbi:MAG: D-sedoheptulose 7-phosphate isomerase [Deltaproteobacteria bacterium]|nr:D-sedoheptulose 7-phosphate isomerase [Deltaproteobacteria bacterium]
MSKATPPSDLSAKFGEVFEESAQVKRAFVEAYGESMARAVEMVVEAFGAGNKILLVGNGGSASDAQHIAAEWVGRFRRERSALPAIALTANTSDLTAIGNDYGFERIFARQVEAHGRAGDILLAISTSGNSPNVIEAVKTAAAAGLKTIGLLGRDGGELLKHVDLAIVVPSEVTARIQESHITFCHALCELVDSALFPES